MPQLVVEADILLPEKELPILLGVVQYKLAQVAYPKIMTSPILGVIQGGKHLSQLEQLPLVRWEEQRKDTKKSIDMEQMAVAAVVMQDIRPIHLAPVHLMAGMEVKARDGVIAAMFLKAKELQQEHSANHQTHFMLAEEAVDPIMEVVDLAALVVAEMVHLMGMDTMGPITLAEEVVGLPLAEAEAMLEVPVAQV